MHFRTRRSFEHSKIWSSVHLALIAGSLSDDPQEAHRPTLVIARERIIERHSIVELQLFTIDLKHS